jgi:hypothetical protein
MNRFSFWQNWLFFLSLGITAFGIFMALFNQSPLFDLFNQQINLSFSGSAPLPEGVTSLQNWLYGVWGATITGWGIFLSFVAYFPFRQGEKWAWNCLVAGLGLWFVLDTGVSWRYGVSFNVIFNIVVAFATGLPLVFTRKAFAYS